MWDDNAQSNPNHKISLLKYILSEGPIEEYPNCVTCGTKLNNLHKNCENCDIPLYDEYGGKHKERNPNHKIRINKRKKPIYIKIKIENELGPKDGKSLYPQFYCVLCDKKYI